jgi:hypothetical protein
MKHFMPVGSSVRPFRDTAKSIQVQLALEGGKFRVTEVPGQNVCHEAVHVADNEGIACRQPRHNRGVFFL